MKETIIDNQKYYIFEEKESFRIRAKKEKVEAEIEAGGTTEFWKNKIKEWKEKGLIE